ncbi:hypothetical protein [Nonomuraea soli]|uniref:Uncharacterized protein n=1 Tax=Nonomuraea soli TaxID=1032476 RepID=A0A7W0HW29_9ACTN|nr:hypothetical protein [Nonomuraea soli]MBA2897775.1 hypothetical protein [Nonomuraea soli]
MLKVISELSVAGMPVWLIAPILLISSLTTLVLALARARASIIRAHGASGRTVALFECRLRYKQWKIAHRGRQRKWSRRTVDQ